MRKTRRTSTTTSCMPMQRGLTTGHSVRRWLIARKRATSSWMTWLPCQVTAPQRTLCCYRRLWQNSNTGNHTNNTIRAVLCWTNCSTSTMFHNNNYAITLHKQPQKYLLTHEYAQPCTVRVGLCRGTCYINTRQRNCIASYKGQVVLVGGYSFNYIGADSLQKKKKLFDTYNRIGSA